MKYTTIVVVSIAVAKTVAYQPTFREAPTERFSTRLCFSSSSKAESCDPRLFRGDPNSCRWNNSPSRSSDVQFPSRSRKRSGVGLNMGGYNTYFSESDSDQGSDKFKEEIGGRKIDRSKTHMIFGVRCIETKHEISEPTSPTSNATIVVGLQPLKDLEDDSSDGTICTDDLEQGKTLSIVLNHLLSKRQPEGRSEGVMPIVPSGTNDEDSDDSHHNNVFELVEVGADPIVSLAVAKLLSGGTRSSNADRRVVVRHPDEQRLRVLEHAHLYFNERTKQNPCSFRTEPLLEDEPFVWLPSSTHSPNGNCVVLFTSPSLVTSRLGEVITDIAVAYNTAPPRYRVLVPSAIISPQQLEKYDYRVVVGAEDTEISQGDNDDGNNPRLLEIISPR